MDFLQLNEGKLVIHPEALAVPEFRVLYDRDKTPLKGKAVTELSYVYCICEFSSKNPYCNYPEDKKYSIVSGDLGLGKVYKPDKEVEAAVRKYNGLQETSTMRLFKSAEIAADKLGQYFREEDPSDSKFTSNLEKLAKIIDTLKKLKDIVRREIVENAVARGNIDIGPYERPQ